MGALAFLCFPPPVPLAPPLRKLPPRYSNYGVHSISGEDSFLNDVSCTKATSLVVTWPLFLRSVLYLWYCLACSLMIGTEASSLVVTRLLSLCILCHTTSVLHTLTTGGKPCLTVLGGSFLSGDFALVALCPLFCHTSSEWVVQSSPAVVQCGSIRTGQGIVHPV